MKKRLTVFLMLSIFSATVFPTALFAEETESATEVVREAEAPSDLQAEKQAEAEDAASQDDLVTTRHTAVIQGEELSYTAITGTMGLKTGGETCRFFFRSYTKDDVEDPADRPITFAFNGGPGSCSYYLELGCLGPRRVEIDDEGTSISMPVGMVDNENSLLDMTDLVFIDAIGTGYSTPTGDSGMEAFIGYENDNRSFGDFIYQYLSRYKRWSSPKYLAGESYGTMRAVGICEYLSDTYSLNLNGLVLLSAIHDLATAEPSNGNELPYALFLPTYAADAWYHEKCAGPYREMTLEEYMDEVRAFASSEYYPALFKGSRMSEAEQEELAEKLSSYLGLSKEFIIENNYRISLEEFCKNLLKDRKLMVGRCDGRYTCPVTSGSLEDGESDPSMIESGLIFGNAFLTYVTEELSYHTDDPYIPTNLDVNSNWTTPGNGQDWIGGYFSQEQTIYECMSRNPYLKIWVNCGYYDSATPFYAAEWVYSHIFLNEDREDKLTFTYYPSGHMFYMEKKSFDQFREEAERWYGQ